MTTDPIRPYALPVARQELLDRGIPERLIDACCTHVSLAGEPCAPDEYALEHAAADDEWDRRYGFSAEEPI